MAYGGGGENFVRTLARQLERAGHKVSIFSLPYNPGRSNNRRPSIPYGIPYNETLHANIKADVAYVMYAPLMWIPYRFKCPTIAGFHSGVFFLNRVNVRYGLVPLLSRAAFKLLGKFDLSRYTLVRLPYKIPNFPHQRVRVVPEFVDAQNFRPRGQKMEKFTVAYVGRPVWQKGWDLFQRIAARAEDEVDVDFVSVGPTKSAPNIHRLGYVSDRRSLAEVYSKVHLVVSPSRADAFPLASVESLSCGTPVLTTPLKAHFEMTLPLLYGTNDTDFLDTISKISSMWNDEREEYGSLQSKCVEAARNYNLEIVMPQWLDMLERVASDESQKAPPVPSVRA